MSLSRPQDATALEAALSRIDEAQRVAGQLNQDANALAAGAAKTSGEVLGAWRTPTRAGHRRVIESQYEWQKDGAQ